MSNQSITYRGTFRGGDPRTFTPDTDHCTPEQLENHAAFCRIWNTADVGGEAMEPEPPQECSPENSAFGVGFQGVYELPEPENTLPAAGAYANTFTPNPNASVEENKKAMRAFLARRGR